MPMLFLSVPFMVDQPCCSPDINGWMVVVYSFDFGSKIFQMLFPIRVEEIFTEAFDGAW